MGIKLEIPDEVAEQIARHVIGQRASDFRPTVFDGFGTICGSADVGPHGWMLYALVRTLKPAVAVEIGMWCGYSTCWIAQALKDNGGGHLWSVDDASLDPERTPSVAEENLARCGLSDYVTIVLDSSPQCFENGKMPKMGEEPIEFAFVDGSHSYRACKWDTEAILARIRHDGCIVFHDTNMWEGVNRYWTEFRERWGERFNFLEFWHCGGLGIAVPKDPVLQEPPRYTEQDFPTGSIAPLSTPPQEVEA